MRKIKTLIWLTLLSIATTACSVDGNITDMTIRKSSNANVAMTGVVPGAIIQTTTGNFYVEATVGDNFSGLRTVTTGGYEVYSNVQGNMISDGILSTVE